MLFCFKVKKQKRDSGNQGRAAYNIAKELAAGRIPTSESIGYEITDDRYVWIPYTTVLRQDA